MKGRNPHYEIEIPFPDKWKYWTAATARNYVIKLNSDRAGYHFYKFIKYKKLDKTILFIEKILFISLLTSMLLFMYTLTINKPSLSLCIFAVGIFTLFVITKEIRNIFLKCREKINFHYKLAVHYKVESIKLIKFGFSEIDNNYAYHSYMINISLEKLSHVDVLGFHTINKKINE